MVLSMLFVLFFDFFVRDGSMGDLFLSLLSWVSPSDG